MYKYLSAAETRYESLKRYNSNSYETKRFEMIVNDLRSRFSSKELNEYENLKNPVLSPEALRIRAIEEMRTMEENRDKNSI